MILISSRMQPTRTRARTDWEQVIAGWAAFQWSTYEFDQLNSELHKYGLAAKACRCKP